MNEELDPKVEEALAEVMPSGLSKAGFRPTPTQRDLKMRLYNRSQTPPNQGMDKGTVEKICGAKIPDSMWSSVQFRNWLLNLHPNAEWTERVEYLAHLLLDRLEVSICHADDKVIMNLAKILPELAGKVKRLGDKSTSVPEHLATLSEEELVRIIEGSKHG